MMGAIINDRIARLQELIAPQRQSATLEEMFQRMTSRVAGIEGPEGEPESLMQICQSWDVPYGRMLTWLMADAARYGVYERALEIRAHELIAQTVGIADGEDFPQNKRVRIETRFKVAKHHAPEKYGEKLEITNTERMEVVLAQPAIELLKLVRRSHEIDVTPEDGEI